MNKKPVQLTVYPSERLMKMAEEMQKYYAKEEGLEVSIQGIIVAFATVHLDEVLTKKRKS